MTLDQKIAALVCYGERTGLIPACERDYSVNQILALFGVSDFAWPDTPAQPDWPLEKILEALLDEAAARGLLAENTTLWRDLFDTRLMNCITPRPAQVIDRFYTLYAQSPRQATDDFYRFCQDSDYIRRYRIQKDVRWQIDSAYGQIELSINLSKPEKDPKAIAAAAGGQSGYPRCQLCVENVGYAGRADHPGRSTHRVIPIRLLGEDWAFQYSPYVYYSEHCIVLNTRHVPMRIGRRTFEKLLDFVRQFPHYFLGSNADLPIVGGSILSHDHYQGGRHDFPMARAPVNFWRRIEGFEDVSLGVVRWPMTALRLRGHKIEPLVDLAAHVLNRWRAYSDPAAEILADTGDTPHNTITPIARKNGADYELDLVLRNNRTTAQYPLGIFHPHPEKHHIKKENIGLIEVMGLAVLPARLNQELRQLAQALADGAPFDGPLLEKHAAWAEPMRQTCRGRTEAEIWQTLLLETGRVFVGVLEDAGVYKQTPAGKAGLERFLKTL